MYYYKNRLAEKYIMIAIERLLDIYDDGARQEKND